MNVLLSWIDIRNKRLVIQYNCNLIHSFCSLNNKTTKEKIFDIYDYSCLYYS